MTVPALSQVDIQDPSLSHVRRVTRIDDLDVEPDTVHGLYSIAEKVTDDVERQTKIVTYAIRARLSVAELHHRVNGGPTCVNCGVPVRNNPTPPVNRTAWEHVETVRATCSAPAPGGDR